MRNIRFSAGTVADPEIVSPRRFFGYLLCGQKVTYETIIKSCDSLESRSSPPPHSGGLLSHSDRRRRTALQKPKIQSARTVRAAASRQRRPATAFASLRSPQSAARKLFHYDACGSLSRAVRRRPTAADCYRIPTAVGEQHSKKRKSSASFHIFCSSERKMNGISSDNHPFEMPILAHARWHDELSFS